MPDILEMIDAATAGMDRIARESFLNRLIGALSVADIHKDVWVKAIEVAK